MASMADSEEGSDRGGKIMLGGIVFQLGEPMSSNSISNNPLTMLSLSCYHSIRGLRQ
jgi:hypothetical protein